MALVCSPQPRQECQRHQVRRGAKPEFDDSTIAHNGFAISKVDLNVVMTASERLIEVQATAERDPFARETLDELLELAAAGIGEIAALQAEAVARELP